MIDEETVRQQARRALDNIDVEEADSEQVVRDIHAEMWRFRQPGSKALFLEEAFHFVQASYDKHLPICKLGDACLLNQSLKNTLFVLRQELDNLPVTTTEKVSPPPEPIATPTSLSHLHPAVQQAAGSRFASAHYSDAIQKACTALEKAVQVKAGQPATVTGTSLMTTAFSKNNPLIQVAADPNEQLGFMNLYQGTVQALRNHYAHNLTELTDPVRALEWLSFISALFYKLDEATATT